MQVIKFKNFATSLVLLAGFINSGIGQQLVNHHANFNSGQQNMWGPSFSPITIDQTITLFDLPWNVNFNTGSSGIFTIAGQSFGGALQGSFSGRIGSEIRIEGFTTGTVEVDYPVDIELNMTPDFSYDQGDNVSIASSYDVRSGWDLDTDYPSAGEFFWDLYFEMAASASATLCFFGCTTFPIIPSFNTGLQTLNLVTISGNGASTGGNTGIWYLGAADPVAPNEPGLSPWPYAKPPAGTVQTTTEIPWQVHIPAFPADIPDTDFGLSGQITIPYVDTDPQLNITNNNLTACGDSTYFNLNLEIFTFLGNILSYVPGPVGAVGTVLENLSGSESIGIAEVSWNFFSASFDANIHNNQCFYFDPTIFGTYEFPMPVEYSVTGTSGTSPVQTGSIIHFEVGETVNYKFPCYSDSMPITPTYDIDGQFRNHTFDEVTFDFLMSALEFGFDVPAVNITPEITVPSICIPYAYPCPTWRKPWRWCTGSFCTPSYTIPALGFPGWELSVGPVWEHSIPLGSFSYDWFDQTWSLEGFQDTTFAAFSMRPNVLGISSSKEDVSCYGGNDGEIQIDVSAVSHATPYQYTVTNGVTQTGNENFTFNGLESAGHIVTVVDANGCQLVTGQTIEEPLPLNVDFSVNDVTCNGNSDGEVNVSVNGGTAAYSYDWSNGQTSQNAINLSAGVYTLDVTDDNGCVETIQASVEQPNLLNYFATVEDVDCNGEATGSININTVGGTLPYNFNWSNGATSQNINNINAGTYTLDLTDANGCIVSNSHTVSEPLDAVSVSLTKIDVNCFEGSDGEISSNVNGGVAPYNFQWSNFNQGVLPYGTQNINGILADDYTLVVVDNNGCQANASIVVDQPATPVSDNPIIVDVDCHGDNTGEVNPNIQGGTAPYNFNWSNGTMTQVNGNLVANSYTLVVTDDNGCTFQNDYKVDEPENPIAIALSVEDVLCHGDATGAVSSAVTGGTAGYNYSWSNGANTQNINGVIADNYTLEITDAKGCFASANETVNEPAQPLDVNSNITDINCHGESTGEIELITVGGTAPYAYNWSNNGNIILSATSSTISSMSNGSYTAYITDANGCEETLTSMINQPAAPVSISGIITDVDCFGNPTGSVQVSTSGGTPNYNFSWSNGTTNEDLTNAIAGTHTLTVTDANNCEENKAFTIKEPGAPLMTSTVPTHVKCFGQENGKVNTFTTGGTMPYDFSWSNAATTPNLSNLPAATYSLTVEDANGCLAFSGTQVQQPDEIVITPNILDASCFGYEDGEIVVDITGGILPYRMTWGNQNQILLNNPSETLSNLPAKDYLIRIRDENDCLREEFITVGQPDTFMVEGTITDVTCFEGEDGSIALDIIGGTSPYDISWSNGLNGQQAANLEAGDYIFTVTDDQGCIVRGEEEVKQPDEITVYTEIEEATCIDQFDAGIYTAIYGGTPPYSFEWNDGSTNSNLEQVPPGDYILTVYDVEMCSNEFEFEIPINESECVIIPNTFTPNGDNYNDTWILGNMELYPNAEVKVFNKWGTEIFSSEGVYNPWDGTYDGNALPSAVYYYIIYLNNEENNKYTGTVTIVR